jgi:hypothetical protein
MIRRTDVECPACQKQQLDVYVDEYPLCECGAQTQWLPRSGAAVAGDDIPGGIEIRHGICNPDGTPKRYYSKTDIKRALNEKGLVVVGDTPGKSYRVNWSGRVNKNVN